MKRETNLRRRDFCKLQKGDVFRFIDCYSADKFLVCK